MADFQLTSTHIVAAASSCLEANAYVAADRKQLGEGPLRGARVYEDAYGVVALVVYETWTELLGGWSDAQAALVDLMSAHMTSADPKSWEGYLVLLTPGVAPPDASPSASDIRYDVSRVRKLIATGDELTQVSDVERTLLPLLPIKPAAAANADGSVLGLLPGLLAGRGVDEEAVRVLIDAFTTQLPLVESLHDFRTSK